VQPPATLVVLDVRALDALWVLGPGLAALAIAGGLLGVRGRLAEVRQRTRRRLSAAALVLFLAGVWWTAGGLGAWRAGVERLRSGTADFVEGTLHRPAASDAALDVGGVSLRRAPDAALPPLHATRWPALLRWSGAHVRLWFFQGDVLRLEVDTPGQSPPGALP